jgi:ADP-ribosylation factor GTPase-activating protein 2/3
MKTGGNESATKYFQSNGGSAALNSKDPKTKYTSNAANKYKDELARRVEADKKKYPGDQIVDETADVEEDAASGAAGGDDDFFSSWDKPAVKRPSNPPSRTGTPAQRAGSPFLKPAGANGNGRPSSPLVAGEGVDAAPKPAPAARSIASTAIRKTAVGGASSKPKPNILGAKKTKLGAKKIDASALDFDEAEKKAREEAERKERLGYDPEEEAAPAAKSTVTAAAASSSTVAPTPVSPGASRDRKDSDVERLGMGVRRLGFGQVGGGGGAAPAPKKMGFGAVAKKPVEGMRF